MKLASTHPLPAPGDREQRRRVIRALWNIVRQRREAEAPKAKKEAGR